MSKPRIKLVSKVGDYDAWLWRQDGYQGIMRVKSGEYFYWEDLVWRITQQIATWRAAPKFIPKDTEQELR